MNVKELKNSRFLTKEDCEPPITLTIKDCVQDNVAPADQAAEMRWTVVFSDHEKPWVLNSTNGQLLAKYFDSPESDDWIGRKITLYHDPGVFFAGKPVGGIRVRKAEGEGRIEDNIPWQ